MPFDNNVEASERPLLGLSDDVLLVRIRELLRSDDTLDQLLNELEIRYRTQQRALILAETLDGVASGLLADALTYNSEGTQTMNGSGMTSIVGGGMVGGMVLGC